MLPRATFWHNKRVLLTGHTGFKGGWLALWLHRLGARVTGIALPPEKNPNLFTLTGMAGLTESVFCDLRDHEQLTACIRRANPEIVLHLAAQPLVRAGYRMPLQTFAVNTMGTVHLLEALRSMDSVRVAVVATTDKVYRNREWSWPYREDDALGGHDPYSASKAASEIVTDCYRSAFFAEKGIALATARAGNVIGGGDWSEDRLIPDAVRAWSTDTQLHIRRPDAIRPWQHVLEPLAGYLRLAEVLWNQPTLAAPWNFGPETAAAATVRNVIDLALKVYGRGTVEYGSGNEGPHEAGLLSLEIAKSRNLLGFQPRWPLHVALQHTMHWYRHQQEGKDARALCGADIDAYEKQK